MKGPSRMEEQESHKGSVPCPLGLGSLLGSQAGSPAPQEQRHAWTPSVAYSLSPTPPMALSSPVRPKHRPHPPPKPHLCLSPAPKAKAFSAFFFLFSPPLFYYCGSVLPSGCCFIFISIFIFFLTYLLVS